MKIMKKILATIIVGILSVFLITACSKKKTTESIEFKNFIYEKTEDGYTILGVKDKTITNITISNRFTSINDKAFEGCTNLKTITMPHTITTIYSNAFDGCDSLDKVFYYGTKDYYMQIGYNFNDSVTVYYYSENKPESAGSFWHYDNGVPTVWVMN